MDQAATTYVETILRAELARGDRVLSGVAPVLSHMLASSGHALVNEAIVARLRGMLSDIARQLLAAAAAHPAQRRSAHAPAYYPDPVEIDALADHLAGEGPVLSHCYALAMEAHLVHRLEQRSSLDPVLSPLLQELIASDDPAVAELAMTALAAQSRFIQAQRRMAMPLGELPARLFQIVLGRWQATRVTDPAEPASADPVLRALKQDYDEGAGRLGLFARLVTAMRGGALAGLELDHAGLSLFVSVLATLTRQPRDLAILACHERQAARLALGLRAAGLDERAIERQFLLLEPAERLPRAIDELPPDRAAALLAQSAAWNPG